VTQHTHKLSLFSIVKPMLASGIYTWPLALANGSLGYCVSPCSMADFMDGADALVWGDWFFKLI
jgi:hypothetical protein